MLILLERHVKVKSNPTPRLFRYRGMHDGIVLDDMKIAIEEVTMGPRIRLFKSSFVGKMPQSALSKEQMGLLKQIGDSPLTLEEKNSMLRYLYFCSVSGGHVRFHT